MANKRGKLKLVCRDISDEELRLNMWVVSERYIMGLVDKVDAYNKNYYAGSTQKNFKPFSSPEEYSLARMTAENLLSEYKPVPSELREKLIEANKINKRLEGIKAES